MAPGWVRISQLHMKEQRPWVGKLKERLRDCTADEGRGPTCFDHRSVLDPWACTQTIIVWILLLLNVLAFFFFFIVRCKYCSFWMVDAETQAWVYTVFTLHSRCGFILGRAGLSKCYLHSIQPNCIEQLLFFFSKSAVWTKTAGSDFCTFWQLAFCWRLLKWMILHRQSKSLRIILAL